MVDDEKNISSENQAEYRSGVGMLLFLTKFSRLGIANSVRELSKMNDRANESHLKELLRVTKFVLDTRYWSLRYKLNDEERKQMTWKLKAYSDSDFAGDKDTRLSVCGYGIYLFDCLISWKSRAMRTHALSSTEAEYIAVSEVLCEILFVRQILEFIGIEIEYPIIIHCDNVGAIFLANNAKVSSRTKHIELKTHFIREYIDKNIVKVIFVRSLENNSDVWTKNTSKMIYDKRTDRFMEKKRRNKGGCWSELSIYFGHSCLIKYGESRLICLSRLRKYEMTIRSHMGILTRIRISVNNLIMFTVLDKDRSLFVFTRDMIDEMFCSRIIIILEHTIKIVKDK